MKGHLTTALAALFISTAACAQTTRQEIFVTSADAAIPYRIPAIAQANDGTLVCVADYRWNRGDIGWSPELYGSQIDLVFRRSHNFGLSFGPEHLLVAGNGSRDAATAGYGDATLVADRESNALLLLCVTGNASWGDTREGNLMRCARITSSDGGRTWSAPTDITASIYGLYDGLQGLFFGSGKLCQSRLHKYGTHHRVYAPMLAKPGGNRVVYSDDFGTTWHALGDPLAQPCPTGDEPKVIELLSGDLLLSSRTDGGRFYNIFHYADASRGTGSWDKPVLSNHANNGVAAKDNACNGGVELVRAIRTADRKPVFLLLQSLPLGPKRSHVGIYYKEFESAEAFSSPEAIAANWDGHFVATQALSAYSEILLLSNNTFAFIYEETSHGQDYTIVHDILTLEQITHGAYTLTK